MAVEELRLAEQLLRGEFFGWLGEDFVVGLGEFRVGESLGQGCFVDGTTDSSVGLSGFVESVTFAVVGWDGSDGGSGWLWA